MDEWAAWMTVGGGVLLGTALLLWGTWQFGIARLPDKMSFQQRASHLALPLAASAVVSILIMVVVNVVVWLWR